MKGDYADRGAADLRIGDPIAPHRPTTLEDWKHWYAVRRARRVTCDRIDPQLAEIYGIDADTIADTVHRWGGPQLPDELFEEWFGKPTPKQVPAPIAVEPVREPQPRLVYDPAAVDNVLVERVLRRNADPSQLSDQEMIAAAGRMWVDGQSITAMVKLLHVGPIHVSKMIGAFRQSTATANPTAGAA
jgi:hypothetical protein